MSTAQTKSRPILFSGAMVRAILAGDKTQTRRVVRKPALLNQLLEWVGLKAIARARELKRILARCPYGVPGERLWVRETWAVHEGADKFSPRMLHPGWTSADVWFQADGRAPLVSIRDRGKGRPSIHMPRWASRIELEVTGVRVERVQDISEADAKAEGVAASTACEMNDGSPCYTDTFQRLWDSINGVDNPKAWDVNPWVWVVEFRRVDAQHGEHGEAI